jgi:F-type H+-transporting ATPase subunit epsilon
MYHLSIVTPEAVVFEGEVISLIAPGKVGYLEVLSHHAPLITILQQGKVTVTDANHQKKVWHITGGALEVSQNRASLLVDSFQEESSQKKL